MLLVKQGHSKVVPFFMVDSGDHVTPKTGLTPSVQISKAGGTFGTPSGTVAEIGNGWYKITLATTDTNILGSLAFYITATGADPVSFSIQVVGFDPESNTNLGLSMIDTNVSTRATDASVWSYSSRTLTSFGTLVSDIWSHSTRTLTAFSTSLAVAVWDVLESAITTANSIGVKVKTNLDATVSSRSTLTDSQVWSYTSRTLTSFGTLVSDIWNYSTRTLTAFSTSLAVAVWDVLESAISTANSIGVKVKTNLDAAVSSRSTLTAAQAADAVWDEPISGHLTSGSTGAALNAAGSSGDPWATPLPGSYGAGTAGNILGNRLDVAVSSRASAADYTSARAAKLDNLDATVSSRSTLTATDVWNHTTRTLTSFGTLVSDIWSHSTRTLTAFSTSLALAVWDVLESAITTANSIGLKVKTNLDTAVSSRASGSDYTAARAAKLDNLDATISSRAPASTALSNATWTDARAAKLDNLDATVSSRSTLTASDVWNHATRTLTSFGSLVSDIWGYTTSVGVSAVTLLERAYRTLVNRMKVNKSTGSVTLYADNNTSTAATGTVTESDTEVTRSKLTWQ